MNREQSKARLLGQGLRHQSVSGHPSRLHWPWEGNRQSRNPLEMQLGSRGVAILLNLCEVLDFFTIGLAVSDGRGRPLFLNRYIQEILACKDGLFVGADGLRAGASLETSTLRRFIGEAAAARGPDRPSDKTIVLPRQSGKRPLLGLVMPSKLDGSTKEGSPVVFLFISDPDWRFEISDKSIGQLFGLTPTEGRIGALLASGNRLDEAAGELGIAVTTARNHLKHIFHKTGTTRQGELTHLLECLLGKIRRD